MCIRPSSRGRSVAGLLVLQLAAPVSPAGAIPGDGSTFRSDRGVVADGAPSGGVVSAELYAGAAGYGVPLELPPGTGGLTPSLALRYSSASRGDSWVGAGWSLGLPSITRSLRRGVPHYDASDRFELDGQELVPDPDVPGRFHTRRETFLRIERETDGSFTVRQKDGAWLRLGTSAETRVEDGPERVFQWLASEMHDPLGNAFAARWDRRDPGTAYLAELRYTLRRDGSGGLRSLDGDPGRDRVVRFVLEPRPDVVTSHLAGLERTLRHRLREVEVRAAGSLVRRWRLAYRTSPDSERSLLASLSIAGADADTATPTPPWVTRFRYRENVPGVQAGWAPDPAWAASWPSTLALVRTNGQDRGVRIADVDGDALPDLIKAYGRNPGNGGDVVSSPDSGVYLSTGAGFEATPSPRYPLPVATGVLGNRIPLSFAMEFPNGIVWGTGMSPVDVTGDGRMDVLGTVGFASGSYPSYFGPLEQSHQGPWCSASPTGFSCLSPEQHYRDHGLYTAVQADAVDFQSLRPSFLYAGGNAQFADVDGDGLLDVTVRGSDHFFPPGPGVQICAFGHSVSYVLRNLGGLRFERTPIEPAMRDYTGDCKRQRAVISAAYQPCTLATSTSCPLTPQHAQTDWKPSPLDGKTWILVGQRDLGLAELDLDGDGLADLLRAWEQEPTEWRRSYLGDGREGYVEAPIWRLPAPLTRYRPNGPNDPHAEGLSQDAGTRFADVNGDGRVDLVRADGRDSTVWLNAGLDATGASPWRMQPTGSWQLPPGFAFVDADGRDTGARLVDLDGDGMTDLVRAQGSQLEVWRNLGAVPDLLVEVTEPLGARTTLGYTPSTRFDHRGGDGVPDLPRSLPLLTRTETNDARGGTSVRTLAYDGGSFDPRRRELRGFRTVTETWPDGTRTLTRFHQDEARSGLVESVVRRDEAGATWLETFREYTRDDDGREPFVSLPAALTRVAWDAGSAPRRTRVEWRYDGGGAITLGNRTAAIELGEVNGANRDLDPTDTRSTLVEYAPENVALHLADRVAVTRLVAGLPGGGGPVLREARLLYDGATLPGTPPTHGLVTQRTDVLGEAGRPDPTTRFVYDEYGNLRLLLDPRFVAGAGGGVTRFEHDPVFHAFRSAVVDAMGQRIELDDAPDASCPGVAPRGLGLVGREIGPNERQAGSARVRCYDAFGRITLERSPDGVGLRVFGYDDRPGLGALVRIDRATASGSLRSERTELDGLGRPVATRRARATGPPVVERTVYDALGRVAARSAPHFEGEAPPWTRQAYDPLGRPTTTTLPGVGRVWSVGRTPAGTLRVDPLGNATFERRDALDRVVSIEQADGAAVPTTRFAWTLADELRSVTDPAGNRAELEHDRLGRRRVLRDPDLGEVRTEYDANGNEVAQRSPAGRVDYAYDALDRPLERRLDGVVDARFGYDAAWLGSGRLAFREDGAGRYDVLSYDVEGRPRVETHVRGATTLAFVTAYDPLGQPASRRYPTGESVVWQHDAAGFLTGIEAGAASVASGIRWNADGSLASWVAANGVRSHTRQDATTRLPAELRVERGGDALSSLRPGFDAADRMLRIADDLDAARSRAFGHDAFGRLRSADGPFGDGGARLQLQYAYDLAGSLVCKDAHALSGCVGGVAFEHPAPGSPRPHAPIRRNGTALGYTPAGHLETIGARRYGYDVLGRLTTVIEGARLVAHFEYEATGARSRTLDLAGARARTALHVGDDFTWDVERRQARIHVFLGGGPIATRAVPFDGTVQAAASTASALRPGAASARGVGRGPAQIASKLAADGGAAALAALLLLALRIGARGGASRRAPAGAARARAVVAGGTSIAFALATSVPARALAPDGDLNRDRRLDAADALLAWEIARGARPPSPDDLLRGDVAPLGAAPESPAEIDPGDVAVLLRALAGADVDGDGLDADAELGLGTSPFSSDSDRDGLADPREAAAGTDAGDPDTDGDGRPDGDDPDPRRGIVYRQLDPLGTPIVVTRDDGEVLARPLYRPFGDAVPGAPGGARGGEPGFNGRRLDGGLGLYDYGARVYAPDLGRFLQADTVVADPLEPGAWNRYAYAAQDPLRRVDPTGHVGVLAALFGLAAGVVAAGSWARGEPGGEALLGGLLNVLTGHYRLGVTFRSDGAIAGDMGYIPAFRWLPGEDPKPPSQQATQLRVMTTAELRFGDILLTNDGGLATAIGKAQVYGEGHGAFVLHADAYRVLVASSDDRGRYVESNIDGAVGGRRWIVFRSPEPLDERRVWAHLTRLDKAGGLNGGLRQYLGNGGGNVCTSFAADLYRAAGGRRIPDRAFELVTPDEIVRYLGPPIGQVYIPRGPEVPDAPTKR